MRQSNPYYRTYGLGLGVFIQVPRRRLGGGPVQDRAVIHGDGYHASITRQQAAAELRYARAVRREVIEL